MIDHRNRNFLIHIKFSIRLCSLLICLTLGHFVTQAQNLEADYYFQNSLSSSGVSPAPPALVPLGVGSYETQIVDGYTRTTRRFPQDNGLSANTSGRVPSNNYTIVILFKLDNVTGRRRIFDPKQGTSNDCGLYVENGRFVGEDPPQPSPPMYADTFVQVVISRQANGNIQIYRDGYVAMAFNDLNAGCYLLNNDNPRFFRDDGTEASAGNIARLRFYDQPMNSNQVRNLDRPHSANGGGGDQSILFTSFRNGNPDIYTMNSDGSNHRRLTFINLLASEARWSPNKDKIVFSNRVSGRKEIYTMPSAIGLGFTRLTNSPANILNKNPSFSPDGTKIIYTRCDLQSGICDLYTMNSNGGNQQPFPLRTQVDDRDYASYSPDGSKIVFTEYQPATNRVRIYTFNLETSIVTPLTNVLFPMYDFQARFSPDGTRIVFSRDTDFNAPNTTDVYVMDANDGSNLTRLTTSNAFNPVWSPNNSQIAFSSPLNNEIEIYKANSTDGSGVDRLTFNSVGDLISDWFNQGGLIGKKALFDFDGDGKSDMSVFRPSDQNWYIQPSDPSKPNYNLPFGLSTDKLTPADFDGDGKTDIAVWRDEPSDPDRANFYIIQSSDSTVRIEQFGRTGDDPSIVGDFDGDNIDDVAVYREAERSVNNYGRFYFRPSSSPNVNFRVLEWGTLGDKAVRADFNGDGIQDIVVRRNATFIIFNPGSQPTYRSFGSANDTYVPADYDGDSKTDLAVFRNGVWYIQQSFSGQFRYETFGLSSDIPVPADYDGDGKVDIAVYRNGMWIIKQSTNGNISFTNFGSSGDKAIPNAYINP